MTKLAITTAEPTNVNKGLRVMRIVQTKTEQMILEEDEDDQKTQIEDHDLAHRQHEYLKRMETKPESSIDPKTSEANILPAGIEVVLDKEIGVSVVTKMDMKTERVFLSLICRDLWFSTDSSLKCRPRRFLIYLQFMKTTKKNMLTTTLRNF
jgi:hypothetical protein